jgi:hypothetical protein
MSLAIAGIPLAAAAADNSAKLRESLGFPAAAGLACHDADDRAAALEHCEERIRGGADYEVAFFEAGKRIKTSLAGAHQQPSKTH